MEHLETFIAECDRKTELAKRRLKETQEELSEEATGKVRSCHIIIIHLYNQIYPKLLLPIIPTKRQNPHTLSI